MRRGFLSFALVAIALVVVPAPAVAAPVVPGRGDVPGFTGGRVPAGIAARIAPPAVADWLKRHSGAALRVRRGRGARNETVVVAAWETPSRAAGGAKVRQWRRALRRSSPTAAKVGDGGFAVWPQKGGGLVVFRFRDVVVLVGVASRSRGPAMRAFVLAVARQEAVLLAAHASRTRWDDLAAQLAARRGRASPATARLALALLGVDAPGVRPLEGTVGQAVDGSLAIAAVESAYRRLSAKQRAAYDAFFRRTFTAPGASPGSRLRAAPSVDEYRTEILALLPRLEEHLGPLGLTILVNKPSGSPVVDRAADTGVFGPGLSKVAEPPQYCEITLYERVIDSRPADQRQVILLHELGHCFQGRFRGVRGFWPDGVSGFTDPPWSVEGLPTWMASAATKIVFAGKTAVAVFDTQPVALTGVDYPGAGFFGIVADTVGEPELWARVPSIMRANGTPDAVQAAVTSNFKEAFDHWGPARTNRVDWGATWTRASPVAQQYAAEPQGVLVGEGSTPVTPPALTGASYAVQVGTPLLQIEPIGDPQKVYGWLHDGAAAQFKANNPPAALFCLVGSCTCPPGQEGQIPDHQQLVPPLTAGLAGGLEGSGGIRLTGVPYSRYCKPKRESPRAPGGSGNRGGGSNGDPHLATFDGLRYDLQSAGEHLLARGPARTFEIQARQEPLRTSSSVSINTQIALRVGTSRVTVSPGEPLVVRVGGRKVDATQTVKLAGGSVGPARSYEGCGGVVVLWDEGSWACVRSVGSYGVAVNARPSAAQAGKLTGLLGNADGDPANDLVTRGGRRLDADTTPRSYRLLYRVLGDSWRITQDESLFDYEPGQSTATFDRRKFPVRLIDIGDLTASQRARAEATCRASGVTDPDLLEDCIIDVAISGDPAFAQSAADEEDVGASAPWTPLSGFENMVSIYAGPSLATTPDGTLHLAAPTSATREPAAARHTVTSVGPDGSQGAVDTLDPPIDGFSRPHLAVGRDGLRLLAYVGSWTPPAPTGIAVRGVVRWTRGAAGWVAGDWLPNRFYGDPTVSLDTPDGTPWTVLVGTGGGMFEVRRGLDETSAAPQPPAGESCYAVAANLAADGPQVWAAWLEWDCTDPARYGYFVAPLDPATGAFGGSVHVPVPVGATQVLYEGLGEPIGFVARPVTGGAWLAYTLEVAGEWHAFLYRAGEATATDLGPVPRVYETLYLAAAPSGRLWVGWYDRTRAGKLLLRFRRTSPEGRSLEPGAWTLVVPEPEPYRSSLRLAANGEALDLVTYVQGTASTPAQVWHVRLAP